MSNILSFTLQLSKRRWVRLSDRNRLLRLRQRSVCSTRSDGIAQRRRTKSWVWARSWLTAYTPWLVPSIKNKAWKPPDALFMISSWPVTWTSVAWSSSMNPSVSWRPSWDRQVNQEQNPEYFQKQVDFHQRQFMSSACFQKMKSWLKVLEVQSRWQSFV